MRMWGEHLLQAQSIAELLDLLDLSDLLSCFKIAARAW